MDVSEIEPCVRIYGIKSQTYTFILLKSVLSRLIFFPYLQLQLTYFFVQSSRSAIVREQNDR